MAKPTNSVIGIDLGKHTFKSVLLQRKGDQRFVLTNYASRTVPAEFASADELAQQVKLLLKEMGGNAKNCAVAASDPHALLRIIEQPTTPVELLRSALRLNGLAVLNQETKDFVLDCAPVSAVALTPVTPDGVPASPAPAPGKTRYLVGGLLRPAVKQISEAMTKTKRTVNVLQLAPVCSFNAFEFAHPEVFAREAFLLLDMGHEQSTVLIGNKGELVLIRSIGYGGRIFGEELTPDGALDPAAARVLVQEGDAGMAEICRHSLLQLATEVRNSIGFFEGQSEESISRVFVSGGLAKTEMILQILSDELGLPCEVWDPLENCEMALPAAKRQALANEFFSLNVACGAALSHLQAA
ncbi:MAG TPA: pilus assembly protein PilM [Chthoniobacterales bacterium]|jgi:type IV pilus assembly protein PilM